MSGLHCDVCASCQCVLQGGHLCCCCASQRQPLVLCPDTPALPLFSIKADNLSATMQAVCAVRLHSACCTHKAGAGRAAALFKAVWPSRCAQGSVWAPAEIAHCSLPYRTYCVHAPVGRPGGSRSGCHVLRPQLGAPAIDGRPQLRLQQACVGVGLCGADDVQADLEIVAPGTCTESSKSLRGSLRWQPAMRRSLLEDMLCRAQVHGGQQSPHRCLRQVACFRTQPAVTCCT